LRLPRGRRQNAPVRLIASLAAAVIAIVAAAAANIASLRSWTASNDLVTHAYAVREALDRALLMAVNAETGERGYLLTGREEYLQPYQVGAEQLGPALDQVRELTRDNPEQQQRLAQLRQVLSDRMALLAEAIELRRRGAT